MSIIDISELLNNLSTALRMLSDMMLKVDDRLGESWYPDQIQGRMKDIQSELDVIVSHVKDDDLKIFSRSMQKKIASLRSDLADFNGRLASLSDALHRYIDAVTMGPLSDVGNSNKQDLLSSAFAFAAREMRSLSDRIEALNMLQQSMGDSGPRVDESARKIMRFAAASVESIGGSFAFETDARLAASEPLGVVAIPPAVEVSKERPEPALTGIVPVMFATERQIKKASDPYNVIFKNKRNKESLTYGVAEISIPKDVHKQGKVERPSVWKFQFSEDAEKHIVINSCERKEVSDWEKLAKRQLREADSDSALMFLHGFNVPFEDCIRKTAQIGWDLKFRGLLVTFDWCAEGGVLAYAADQDNALLAIPRFIGFLKTLRTKVGVNTIHVVAHSMGNLLLVEALRRLALKDKKTRVLHEVVFAAPDVNADDFKAAIKEIRRKARRYTLYGSKTDKAIKVSKGIRKDHPRAGDGGDNLVVIKGVESIDATNVGEDMLGLGHSYFSSERTVLSDIYYVVQESLAPSKRHGLLEQMREVLPYWVFNP